MRESTQSSGSITISVNGISEPTQMGQQLAALLQNLGVADRKGIAVALNDAVVPKASWPAVSLSEGDKILIITATQGG